MRTLHGMSSNNEVPYWWDVDIAYRHWIHDFTGRLKGKPLLDMVGGVIEDYEHYWNEYYFADATM